MSPKCDTRFRKFMKHADGCSEFNKYEMKCAPLSLSTFNLNICLIHISLLWQFPENFNTNLLSDLCQAWKALNGQQIRPVFSFFLVCFFVVPPPPPPKLCWMGFGLEGPVHPLQCSSRLEVCRLRQLNVCKKNVEKAFPITCLLNCEQLLGC